ncbi:MAG: hypothetical protein K9N55_13595 [Phycisphaerae bacterium]|nr:hypothetical protein [Phycisphaerae bacterium]
MPSVFNRWVGTMFLCLLCVLAGCTKTDELDKAVRRAEKAEQTVSSLRQVRDELIEKKKDLELQVLQLQQPDVAEANDPVVSVEPQAVSDDPAKDIETLKQQLLLARTEIQEKDKDIQALQNLVEALTHTVNQLQGLAVEEVIPEEEMQDSNALEVDVKE